MGEIRVRVGGVVLVYDSPRNIWIAVGKDPLVNEYLSIANTITRLYTYHPAHGYPGYHLAQKVAKNVRGVAELPPVPQSPQGVIH